MLRTRSAYGMERVIEGERDVRLDTILIAIPVPGHTRPRGLAYREKFLFTVTIGLVARERALTAFRAPAGIHGRSRRALWKSYWITISSGCCPDTGAFTITRPKACERISCDASSG